jgi:hypothetical protein
VFKPAAIHQAVLELGAANQDGQWIDVKARAGQT